MLESRNRYAFSFLRLMAVRSVSRLLLNCVSCSCAVVFLGGLGDLYMDVRR
jgi:hypothetical protein